MDRIVAAAPLDVRGAGARVVAHLQVLAADFRSRLAGADCERWIPRFRYGRDEARVDFGVAAGDRGRAGNWVRLYSAARANDPRLAARGKRGAAGNGAGASAGPDGRDARSRAVCAGARDLLPDDGQTAVACDGIIYPARRDCHRAAVCGVCLEVAAGRREDVNPRIIYRGTVLTWTECPLGKAPLHSPVRGNLGQIHARKRAGFLPPFG